MHADEVVSVTGEKNPIPLEIFRPRGDGPWPAVLVIHEILGLNQDIRRIARRFAENGYLAACPDLLADGNRLRCVRAALRALRAGDGAQVQQLRAALDVLRARPETAGVGVVGFCMGGGFATLLATTEPLGAAAVFYGDIRPSGELRRACPMVGGYGAKDPSFRAKGERLKRRLSEYGIPHDVVIYEQAGHSYMNRAVRPALVPLLRPLLEVGYDEAAAEDSWRRMLAFFAHHLKERTQTSALASTFE